MDHKWYCFECNIELTTFVFLLRARTKILKEHFTLMPGHTGSDAALGRGPAREARRKVPGSSSCNIDAASVVAKHPIAAGNHVCPGVARAPALKCASDAYLTSGPLRMGVDVRNGNRLDHRRSIGRAFLVHRCGSFRDRRHGSLVLVR
jgi:hypothetical protein